MSIKESIKFLGTWLFSVSLFATMDNENESHFNSAIILMILFLIVYSALLYVGVFGTIEVKQYYFTRYVPESLSAVDLSVLICMFIPFLLYNIKSAKLISNKLLWSILAVCMVLSMLIYVARVSFIALAFALVFLLICKKDYYKTIILSIILLAISFIPSVQELFQDSFSTNTGTLGSRIWDVWLPAINGWSKYFLFGLGGRSFEIFNMNMSGMRVPAHNILLSILVENGVIVVILFVLYNYSLFKEGLQGRTDDVVLYSLLPLVMFCVSAMTSTLQPNLFYKIIYMFYLPIIVTKKRKYENGDRLPVRYQFWKYGGDWEGQTLSKKHGRREELI